VIHPFSLVGTPQAGCSAVTSAQKTLASFPDST
jgi:hypothetical protein